VKVVLLILVGCTGSEAMGNNDIRLKENYFPGLKVEDRSHVHTVTRSHRVQGVAVALRHFWLSR